MPPGEEMFYYHGYSGPCPAVPLERPARGAADAVVGSASGSTGASSPAVPLAPTPPETVEKLRTAVIASNGQRRHVDALIAAVRAESSPSPGAVEPFEQMLIDEQFMERIAKGMPEFQREGDTELTFRERQLGRALLNALRSGGRAHLTEQEQTGSGNTAAQEPAQATGRSAAPSFGSEVETLLREADQRKCQVGDGRDVTCEAFGIKRDRWCLKCRLASALRASETAKQQAEQERDEARQEVVTQIEVGDKMLANVVAALEQAESYLAQREAEIARHVEQAFTAGWDASACADTLSTSDEAECIQSFADYLKSQTEQQKGQG